MTNKIGNIPAMDGEPHEVKPVPEPDNVEEEEEETPEEEPEETPAGEGDTPASPKPSDAPKPDDDSEEEEPEDEPEDDPKKEEPEAKPKAKPKEEPVDDEPDDEETRKRKLQGLTDEEKSLDKDLEEIDATKTRIVEKRRLRREGRAETKDKPEGDETGEVVTKGTDDLSDLDPEYVKDIERVIKSKGFVTKGELSETTYGDAVKAAKAVFIKANPEYDPDTYEGGKMWEKLQEKLSTFAKPDDPSKLGALLKDAKFLVDGKGLIKTANPATHAAKTKKTRLQSSGGGGGGGGARPTSKSSGKLTDDQKEQYRRGGFSEEDIAEFDS